MIYNKKNKYILLLYQMVIPILLVSICTIILAKDKKLVELDLGLTVDSVTQATPGYSRGLTPPHLRKETGKKRPAFMVVRGLKNLALYKPVSSKEEETVIGDIDQINDGIKKSDEFNYVEFGPSIGWVEIDLKEKYAVHAIVIWHYYRNAVIYNDVIVQVADDAAFSRKVMTLFNNDHDNSAGLGKGRDKAFYSRWWGEIVDARGRDHKGVRARFVRVYTGTGMEEEPPRFVEINVYGK